MGDNQPSLKASHYRPQTSRCIEIIGEFTDQIAVSVLPSVLKCRSDSNDPITVYIHSPGGLVTIFEAIDCALRTADLDGNDCLVITVAVGNVSSAAANLLVLGDYSYAYADSTLLFHGTRLEEVQVTFEGARNMAAHLDNINRRVARRIMQAILPRVMFRFLQLRQKAKTKKSPHPTPEESMAQFKAALQKRLSPKARQLVERVCTKVSNASALTEKVLAKLEFKRPGSDAKQDARVLRALITHELRELKGKGWQLDESGMNRLVQDYFLLREFNVGRAHPLYYSSIMTWGPEFLNSQDASQFGQFDLPKDEQLAIKFLDQKTGHYIAHLWFFTITLSHSLSVGENSISSQDAYWLGLIDEVIGKKFQSPRTVMESKEKEQDAACPIPTA